MSEVKQTVARLTVQRGALTEYPLAERVPGGWQNGVTFYPDADVVKVQELRITPALDSAPSVARALPDREALARVIDIEHMRLHGSSSGDFGVYLRIADAVLAAIEKGGE